MQKAAVKDQGCQSTHHTVNSSQTHLWQADHSQRGQL